MRSLIDLGHRLGLRVTAEGVETRGRGRLADRRRLRPRPGLPLVPARTLDRVADRCDRLPDAPSARPRPPDGRHGYDAPRRWRGAAAGGSPAGAAVGSTAGLRVDAGLDRGRRRRPPAPGQLRPGPARPAAGGGAGARHPAGRHRRVVRTDVVLRPGRPRPSSAWSPTWAPRSAGCSASGSGSSTPTSPGCSPTWSTGDARPGDVGDDRHRGPGPQGRLRQLLQRRHRDRRPARQPGRHHRHQGLCGRVVAVEGGTTQVDLLARAQCNCPALPIIVRTYATNSDALVQLRTGRAVAVLNDLPPAVFLVNDPRTKSYYQLASTTQYEPGLYGVVVAKDQTRAARRGPPGLPGAGPLRGVRRRAAPVEGQQRCARPDQRELRPLTRVGAGPGRSRNAAVATQTDAIASPVSTSVTWCAPW